MCVRFVWRNVSMNVWWVWRLRRSWFFFELKDVWAKSMPTGERTCKRRKGAAHALQCKPSCLVVICFSCILKGFAVFCLNLRKVLAMGGLSRLESNNWEFTWWVCFHSSQFGDMWLWIWFVGIVLLMGRWLVLLVLKQYLGFILSKYVDMWLGILEADDLMLGVFFFFFFLPNNKIYILYYTLNN